MKNENGGEGRWPIGKYCIFRKNGCPAGMTCTGYVKWDLEYFSNVWGIRYTYKSSNEYSGIIPDVRSQGITDNLVLYFACHTSGNVNEEIELPVRNDFYLFRHGGACQKV